MVPVGGLSIESLDEGECVTVTRYSLRAFATHTGDLLGGHYEAFICRTGAWWRIDDARATGMAPMPQGVRAAAVYALFLQRAVARCTAVCGRLEDDAPVLASSGPSGLPPLRALAHLAAGPSYQASA